MTCERAIPTSTHDQEAVSSFSGQQGIDVSREDLQVPGITGDINMVIYQSERVSHLSRRAISGTTSLAVCQTLLLPVKTAERRIVAQTAEEPHFQSEGSQLTL